MDENGGLKKLMIHSAIPWPNIITKCLTHGLGGLV
jgi:hypothetical protein